MNTESLDEIIKKYSLDLEQMGYVYGGEAPPVSVDTPEPPSNSASEETSESESTDLKTFENNAKESVTEEIKPPEAEPVPEEEPVNTEPAAEPSSAGFSKEEATSFADFFARIQSGNGTYPVIGAKVVVYRDDNIYAFVESDENGITKKVRLPAFPESNSLKSENKNQSLDYYADVFAEGFITKKGLLISAVGGSEIVLDVLLTPQGERTV